MNDKEDWKTRFIAKLQELEKEEDRATLAELRRGLGKDVTYLLAHVGWLFAGIPDYGLDDAALIAALFASHPKPGGDGSLGSAFRQLCQRTESESIEKRFVALLDSDREDLPDRLRHCVSLLKAKDKEIPVGWWQLLTDLQRWNYDSRWVQKKWSRDFWAEAPSEEPTVESTTASSN